MVDGIRLEELRIKAANKIYSGNKNSEYAQRIRDNQGFLEKTKGLRSRMNSKWDNSEYTIEQLMSDPLLLEQTLKEPYFLF